MKREIIFSNGIIEGEIKRVICGLFPELEKQFRRRKQYDEYYFDGISIDIKPNAIEKLSDEYCIKLSCNELEIII